MDKYYKYYLIAALVILLIYAWMDRKDPISGVRIQYGEVVTVQGDTLCFEGGRFTVDSPTIFHYGRDLRNIDHVRYKTGQ